MKKFFNSSGVLIGLILIFIAVVTNRRAINSPIEKAIINALPDDNYAEQWRVKPGSIYDGDTLSYIDSTM